VSHLGATRPDSRAPVPLQLENHFHCRRNDNLELYFQIFAKAVGKEEIIIFLAHLLRYLRSPLLVVWDRLPAHRSRLVREFLDSLGGQIAIEYLPAYAPELNPVEYLWGHWKQHELPNVCPRDLWQLSEGARRTLRRLRRRPRLITAFWKRLEQSSLPFD
jgi:transposase